MAVLLYLLVDICHFFIIILGKTVLFDIRFRMVLQSSLKILDTGLRAESLWVTRRIP